MPPYSTVTRVSRDLSISAAKPAGMVTRMRPLESGAAGSPATISVPRRSPEKVRWISATYLALDVE
jgi:hypothetical protein